MEEEKKKNKEEVETVEIDGKVHEVEIVKVDETVDETHDKRVSYWEKTKRAVRDAFSSERMGRHSTWGDRDYRGIVYEEDDVYGYRERMGYSSYFYNSYRFNRYFNSYYSSEKEITPLFIETLKLKKVINIFHKALPSTDIELLFPGSKNSNMEADNDHVKPKIIVNVDGIDDKKPNHDAMVGEYISNMYRHISIQEEKISSPRKLVEKTLLKVLDYMLTNGYISEDKSGYLSSVLVAYQIIPQSVVSILFNEYCEFTQTSTYPGYNVYMEHFKSYLYQERRKERFPNLDRFIIENDLVILALLDYFMFFLRYPDSISERMSEFFECDSWKKLPEEKMKYFKYLIFNFNEFLAHTFKSFPKNEEALVNTTAVVTVWILVQVFNLQDMQENPMSCSGGGENDEQKDDSSESKGEQQKKDMEEKYMNDHTTISKNNYDQYMESILDMAEQQLDTNINGTESVFDYIPYMEGSTVSSKDLQPSHNSQMYDDENKLPQLFHTVVLLGDDNFKVETKTMFIPAHKAVLLKGCVGISTGRVKERRSEYLKVVRRTLPTINKLTNKLILYTETKEDEMTAMKEGHLDTNKIVEGIQNVESIFKKKYIKIKPKITVALLIDVSGSMSSGDQMRRVMEASIILNESLKKIYGHFDYYVYLHTADVFSTGSTEITVLREKGYVAEHYMGIMTPSNQNRDGIAILETIKRVQRMKDKDSPLFFIHVSDGQPSAEGSSYHGGGIGLLRDSMKKVPKIGDRRTEVLHVNVLDNASHLKGIYKHNVYMRSFSELPSLLSKHISKIARDLDAKETVI